MRNQWFLPAAFRLQRLKISQSKNCSTFRNSMKFILITFSFFYGLKSLNWKDQLSYRFLWKQIRICSGATEAELVESALGGLIGTKTSPKDFAICASCCWSKPPCEHCDETATARLRLACRLASRTLSKTVFGTSNFLKSTIFKHSRSESSFVVSSSKPSHPGSPSILLIRRSMVASTRSCLTWKKSGAKACLKFAKTPCEKKKIKNFW